MRPLQDIAIYGAGGLARQVYPIIKAINEKSPTWRFRGYIVDPEYAQDEQFIGGFPVKGDLHELMDSPSPNVIIGIGDGRVRQRVVAKLDPLGCVFPSVIHPGAWIGENVSIGKGTIISAGCSLSTDIEVGDHSYLNAGCVINHDAKIGAFCTTGPGVNMTGGSQLEDGVTVGVGAMLIPGVVVAKNATIGAGSVVVKDIPTGMTAYGVPAKVAKSG